MGVDLVLGKHRGHYQYLTNKSLINIKYYIHSIKTPLLYSIRYTPNTILRIEEGMDFSFGRNNNMM